MLMPAFFRDIFEQNFKFQNTFLRNMLWLYHRLYVCTVSVFSYQMLIGCSRHITQIEWSSDPFSTGLTLLGWTLHVFYSALVVQGSKQIQHRLRLPWRLCVFSSAGFLVHFLSHNQFSSILAFENQIFFSEKWRPWPEHWLIQH